MVHLNLRNIVYTRKQKHISQLYVLVSAYIQYMGMQSYLISTQQDYHHMSAKIRLEGHIWIFYDVILTLLKVPAFQTRFSLHKVDVPAH